MSYEGKVLSAAIASREAYERVAPFLSDPDLSPPAQMWWKLIVAWYASDRKAGGVDKELLRERGKRDLPQTHQKTLLAFYDELPEAPSPMNAVVELLQLRRTRHRADLMMKLQNAPAAEQRDAWLEYERLLEATSMEDVSDAPITVEQAFETRNPERLIKLSPAALHERIGGIGPGETLVLFGRPEIGKSLFSISIACGAVRQGKRVLYLGNEEPVARTMLRCMSNLLGRTTHQILANQDKAAHAAREKGIELITFRQIEPGSVAQIERYVDRDEPALVIVDQVRHITSKGQTLTTRLEEVQQGLRVLSSKYGFACVSVTQAGDSADGKVYLDMGDIDSSNTGLQGACDALVGIGADKAMANSDRRGLSLPKNKLGHTHEGCLVSIDRLRNTVL